jgi:hypothetical protein
MRYLFWAAVCGAVIGGASFIPKANAASGDSFPNVCVMLRSGASLVQIETTLLARGYTDAQAGAFTGQTVIAHCADQIPNVRRQLA